MKTPIHLRYASWYKTLVLPSTAAALLIASPAYAANMYWDVTANNGQIDAGSGTWDTTTTNTDWTTSSTGAAGSNTYWTNTNSLQAVFGGASAAAGTYVVNVSSAGVQAQTLRFLSSGYIFTATTSATIALGYGSTTSFNMNAGVVTTIGDNVTVLGGVATYPGLTLTGAGTVNIEASSAAATATVRANSNYNTNIQGGATVVVGTNGILQTGLVVNGGGNNGNLVVGNDSGDATLTVNGGTVNYGNLILSNTTANGISTLNVEKGTVATLNSGSGVLRFGPTSVASTSGTAVVNLDGGTLSICGVTVGNAASAAKYFLNFNGGVLQVAGTSSAVSTFLASASQITANVLTRGAVIDTNGYNATISQALVSGTASDGGLTKQGLGILTLNAANTYNGATTVKQGTLALGAAGTISNSLILGASGGTTGTLDVTLKGTGANYALHNLTGNGSVVTNAGTVTADGVIAPGFSTGVLDIKGNLTLTSSALVQLEIASAGTQIGVDFDAITLNGTLTYGGSLTVSGYNGYDFAQAGSYNLFDFTAKSGDFSSVTVNNIALIKAGETWADASSQYSFDQTTGILNVALVPEPGTYAMLVGGLGMLGLLRRKLRR